MALQSKLFKGDTKLEAAATSDAAHITRGAAGPHVAKIQEALGTLDDADINSGELQATQYGEATAAAVLDYKRARNIVNHTYQKAADNIVGRMTMASLDREMFNFEQGDVELEIVGPILAAPQSAVAPVAHELAFAFSEPPALAPRRPGPPRHAPPRVTVLAITGTPEMPAISFRCNVHGADAATVAGTTFNWVLTVQFDASACRNGPNRSISMTRHQAVVGDNLIPTFPAIRGGHLSAAVSANINGRRRTDRLTNVRIIGTNPSRADLFAALPNKTLRRMALQESGGKQFDAPADGGTGPCPLWSGDRLGGVGLFQITNPRPTDDEVWNWRSNIAGGIRIFNEKLAAARGYPEHVRRSARFAQLVAAFNAHRRATHAGRPLTITLPDFTTGDFDDNLQQLELDAIRGYNGFAGNEGFGRGLHEFRVALEHGRLRIESIDEVALTGSAVWERVPVAARPQTTGDPNYVARVLGHAV